MLSLEPELRALATPDNERNIAALIARERREVFSIHPELRVAGWLGATLLAAAAGILLKNNLERIGPVALAVLTALAAAACYAWTWWRRARSTVIDDYVLLLGALLVSADVAFVESQFHLFDDAWKHHLIILAVAHAAAAYLFRSRMVLSLAIMSLAGWIGFEENRQLDDVAVPAFITAAVLLLWREIDRRVVRPATTFSPVFEHFAAHIALVGALTLLFEDEIVGGVVMLAIACCVIAWGFFARRESFVLYGFVYAVIAVDVLLLTSFAVSAYDAALIVAISVAAAVAALLVLHARFRGARA